MQYSDHVDMRLKQHRNASLLGVPVSRPSAVTLANLSPLNWQAGNYQHSISYDSIERASALSGMGNNPDYGSWHLRDYMVG